MKIFLTGATGFIGKNLAERWQLQGHEVRCYVRGESCAVALSTFAPDAVVNCAAEIYDPSLMFSANVELVRAVLEHALSRPAVKVIQARPPAPFARGPCCVPPSPVDRAACLF